MGEDGSIIIRVDLDDAAAQRELNTIVKKIDSLQGKIRQAESARLPLAEQAEQLAMRLQEAKDQLASMQGGGYSSEAIAEQKETVAALQARWREVSGEVEKYTRQIVTSSSDLEAARARAGELSASLAGASNSAQEANVQTGGVANSIRDADDASASMEQHMEQIGEAGEVSGERAASGMETISAAAEAVSARIKKLEHRLVGLVKRVFVFSLITKALRGVRTWFTDLVKSNDEASAAIGRLKAALLTLVQPIADVVIPAFIRLVEIITSVINAISAFVSKLFGTTAQKSAEAAEKLNDEKKAIKGVGSAAKKAAGQLASFDQINKLTAEDAEGGGGGGGAIGPDFAGNQADLSKWDQMFDGLEEKIAAALLIGGIVLIVLGAAMLNLGLVLAGLALLGAGIAYGESSGVFADWAAALGLENAAAMVTAALLIAGIAALIIGICTGNILLFLAGAVMIGAGIAYGDSSGVFDDWAQKLGLESGEEMVTAALLIAGIAAVVIGICTGNVLLFIAGAVMIGAGIAYGESNDVFDDWAQKLGLDTVFDYVVVAIQLVGIALVAIGAAMGNIGMIVAGAAILAIGIAAEQIGEETLKEWWEVLRLTTVAQWIGVITMLAGIALIGIGVVMANIWMVLGGMALVGMSTAMNTANNNLKDWVAVLGLEKVAGWVTAALLLGGIALVVIGIVTANPLMVLAGLGMLGAGISVGLTSGTFQSWLDTISGAFLRFKDTIVNAFNQLWNFVKNIINGILGGIEGLANGVIRGINKVIDAINSLQVTIPDWIPGLGGKSFGFNLRRLDEVSIPRLAAGAVIPPNREFMAVLGDQKSGTNIEAPLDTIVTAFRQAVREMNGGDQRIEVRVFLDSREIKAGQQRLARVTGG